MGNKKVIAEGKGRHRCQNTAKKEKKIYKVYRIRHGEFIGQRVERNIFM